MSLPESKPWRTKNTLAKKFVTSLHGVGVALREDRSVGMVLTIAALSCSAAIALSRWVDVLAIVVSSALLVVTELVNTAVEELCDVVQPNFDRRIGKVKDVLAGATLIATCAWLAVMAFELLSIVSTLLRG